MDEHGHWHQDRHSMAERFDAEATGEKLYPVIAFALGEQCEVVTDGGEVLRYLFESASRNRVTVSSAEVVTDGGEVLRYIFESASRNRVTVSSAPYPIDALHLEFGQTVTLRKVGPPDPALLTTSIRATVWEHRAKLVLKTHPI